MREVECARMPGLRGIEEPARSSYCFCRGQSLRLIQNKPAIDCLALPPPSHSIALFTFQSVVKIARHFGRGEQFIDPRGRFERGILPEPEFGHVS